MIRPCVWVRGEALDLEDISNIYENVVFVEFGFPQFEHNQPLYI